MAELLLFNIHDPEKRMAIRLTALRLGLLCREIPPERQGMTISELLEGSVSVTESEAASFEDEMLLMHALSQEDFHTLLDTLRQNGQSVRLKAVVTDHNRSWTAARLHRELLAEEESIRRWKQSRHKQKKR
ncbi:MAG: DUF3783 domain-containing protein [Oscillospiraceae bacterium]|nr:DUF3783 domain-containing protein [Oscillospiraceae bacterium]MBR0392826.1 DUF3783 domain-containing protein [Oscillospiraceae bacterium]